LEPSTDQGTTVAGISNSQVSGRSRKEAPSLELGEAQEKWGLTAERQTDVKKDTMR